MAIVVYAGRRGLGPALDLVRRTSGQSSSALDELQAGGSTNGGAGIQLAYDIGRPEFIKSGTNRVILCHRRRLQRRHHRARATSSA